MASTKKDYRKLSKQGRYGYYVTLPTDLIRKLRWHERKKLTVKLNGKSLTIKDWKPKKKK